jgi:hypothetical protein
MCDIEHSESKKGESFRTIPVYEAIGTVLAHDVQGQGF